MNHKPLIIRYLERSLTAGTALALASCGDMPQRQSGQTGGLIGAGIGALTGGALAKSSGANRGQSAAASVVGGLAGYTAGTKIGQSAGDPNVHHTEVPNQ